MFSTTTTIQYCQHWLQCSTHVLCRGPRCRSNRRKVCELLCSLNVTNHTGDVFTQGESDIIHLSGDFRAVRHDQFCMRVNIVLQPQPARHAWLCWVGIQQHSSPVAIRHEVCVHSLQRLIHVVLSGIQARFRLDTPTPTTIKFFLRVVGGRVRSLPPTLCVLQQTHGCEHIWAVTWQRSSPVVICPGYDMCTSLQIKFTQCFKGYH